MTRGYHYTFILYATATDRKQNQPHLLLRAYSTCIISCNLLYMHAIQSDRHIYHTHMYIYIYVCMYIHKNTVLKLLKCAKRLQLYDNGDA